MMEVVKILVCLITVNEIDVFSFFFQRTASNRMEIWGRSNTITKEWFNSERPNETHAFNLSIYQRESKKYFDYIL